MAQKPIVDTIIDTLHLEPHPEGGYFRETYRGEEIIDRKGNARNVGTGIYFLLPEKICTNWHRVNSDELWHFYQGENLALEIIDVEDNIKQFLLGDDLESCSYQQLVPRNCWQRAYCTGEYSLVGCTVAPGFEFEDFEMIDPKELADRHPDIASKIVDDPFVDKN